jgi:hypothetical protein
VIRFLLENGLDPSVANKEGKVPYRVAKDNETRKIFRKFQADFPNKYDYKKVNLKQLQSQLCHFHNTFDFRLKYLAL